VVIPRGYILQIQVAVALRALLAPAWQRLRVLDLAYVNLEASLVAVEVATLCPKLEALSVSHCEAVDDAAVVALARGPCAGKGAFFHGDDVWQCLHE
jgi:hypothetical protein